MNRWYIGFVLYYDTVLVREPKALTRVAELILDPRWPWPPLWGTYTEKPGSLAPRRRRFAGPKALEALVELMANPEGWSTTLLHRVGGPENPAAVTVKTGQDTVDTNARLPFSIDGQIRGSDIPPGTSVLSWLDLVHDLALAVRAVHGVLCVWPSAAAVLSDISLADIGSGLPEPFNDQRRRAKRWRDELGASYARHPRWGTYLHRAQVDAIGGIDRLLGAVQPAYIRPVGEAIFIQLTPLPEDALGPEGEDKRRRLEDLMTPILVPALPT